MSPLAQMAPFARRAQNARHDQKSQRGRMIKKSEIYELFLTGVKIENRIYIYNG